MAVYSSTHLTSKLFYIAANIYIIHKNITNDNKRLLTTLTLATAPSTTNPIPITIPKQPTIITWHWLPKINYMEKKCAILLSSAIHDWIIMAITDCWVETRSWAKCESKKSKRFWFCCTTCICYKHVFIIAKLSRIW